MKDKLLWVLDHCMPLTDSDVELFTQYKEDLLNFIESLPGQQEQVCPYYEKMLKKEKEHE